MFGAYLGKYKSIIVSIALFIILDASVLMLNFYISFEIAEDAVGVNLAGRQRMLSQRMVKSLLDMDFSSQQESEKQLATSELDFTLSLFDETLSAFDSGGVARSAGGGEVYLNAVTSEKGRSAIEEAKLLWSPYKQLLEKLLVSDSEAERSIVLISAISYAKENNLILLKLMNDLTVDLENVARSKATRLRMIQTIGITLAVINFFIILFHFIGELRRGDKKLEVARQETTRIMDTVNEGLFLIDKQFEIASQHSKKVSSMFGHDDISGYSFEKLLEDLVSNRNMETSKRFISLLFREDIKSNLIRDLNPLREIELNIADDSGGYISKFFSFDFARVYGESAVENILVTVVDVTEKVSLERELQAVREQTEQQLEVLTGILHANPSLLKRFVVGSFESFHKINLLLREPAKTELALRKKLGSIFVEIHNVKGEAGALGLESFEELAHKFEEDIREVQNREEINGDDFFPLVVLLEKLIRHCETVQSLSEKLAAFGRVDSSNESTSDEWKHLYHLVDSVAKRHSKKVELVTSGLTEVSLTDELKKLVSEVSVQCIRNAVVHGIEPPEDRLDVLKDEKGRIDLRLNQMADGTIELSIKDDGRGLDEKLLRAQALASGRWTEDELEAWDNKQLVSLIFQPGFSTSEKENLDSGRGVGMDVIKDRLRQCRGKVRISSRLGVNTSFLISIPPPIHKEIAA